MTESPTSRAPQASTVTAPETAAGRVLLDFLEERFPKVGRTEWLRRLAAGLVSDGQGVALPADWIVPGRCRLRYWREVTVEPVIPFEETILYQDERLLVVDKPHFVPVTPSGPWVNECLLYRLMRKTGCERLIPLHRLDRETAGLVLFSTAPGSRAAYATLFMRGEVGKRYEAIGSLEGPPSAVEAGREWAVESRIVKGEPWFRMAEVEGPVNARTRIRLRERRGGWGRFDIEPATGKQHQIRLHMARIGAPIRNDWLYPVLQPEPKAGLEQPLMLLARELAFRDPVTGVERFFRSGLRLDWPAPGVSPGA
jgi:tRNA pseudouridine32 synthase/23S rRNA pseudouridine746 synthase